MTHNILESVFSGKSRLAVLRCLYSASEGLTGREVARRSGFSHQQAHKELRQLVALGLATVQRAGSAQLFSLNRKSWLAAEVVDVVFKKEKTWLDSLLRDVSADMPACVQSLVLFGSAASGTLRLGSDIDLLALTGRAADKKSALGYFSDISGVILQRYGLPLSPLVLTTDEFSRKYRQNDEFARTVLKTGRVVKGKLLAQIV